MKKHFEQAIAFDRDSPLNQRTALGKKYNELVDEYNALEEKYNKAVGETPATSEEPAVVEELTEVENATEESVKEDIEEDTAKKSGLGSLFGKRN